jgi:hypothetical protein
MVPLLGAGLVGLGAALPTLAGAGGAAIADRFSASGKAMRAQQKKDISDLQRGKLGLSDAEKRSMLGETQRGLQAQTAGIEANLRRQAAAAGGFGRSGAQTRALTQMAAGQQEQMAKAAGGVDALSQQQAQQRFQGIMDRLGQRRQEAMQMGAALGGAAAQGIKAGVGSYGGLKADYLSEGASTARAAYEQAKTGGDAAAIAQAKAQYDAELAKARTSRMAAEAAAAGGTR